MERTTKEFIKILKTDPVLVKWFGADYNRIMQYLEFSEESFNVALQYETSRQAANKTNLELIKGEKQ